MALLSASFRWLFTAPLPDLRMLAEQLRAELLPGCGSLEDVLEGRKAPMASTSLEEFGGINLLHWLLRVLLSFLVAV